MAMFTIPLAPKAIAWANEELYYAERHHWSFSVVICLSLWTLVYMAFNRILFRAREGKVKCCDAWEGSSRCVTLVHALLIIFMSGWSAFVEGPWPFTDPADSNTRLEHWTCVVTLSYFIFDLLWCLYFRTEGSVMLFHHVLSIFGNSLVLSREANGCEMMATLFGSELTNPLLQCRWFLRRSSWKSSYLAVLVDVLFLVVFTIMRIGVASVLLYSYLTHPRPDWVTRCGAVTIYVVGWIFWTAILRYAWHKYGHYVVSKFYKSKVATVHDDSTGERNGNVDSVKSCTNRKAVIDCRSDPKYRMRSTSYTDATVVFKKTSNTPRPNTSSTVRGMIKEGTIGFQERNVEEQKNESSAQLLSQDQNDAELSRSHHDVTVNSVSGHKKPSLIEAALQRTDPSEILSMLDAQLPVDVPPATPQRKKSTNKESSMVKQSEQNLFPAVNGTMILGKKEGCDGCGLHHRSVPSNS